MMWLHPDVRRVPKNDFLSSSVFFLMVEQCEDGGKILLLVVLNPKKLC